MRWMRKPRRGCSRGCEQTVDIPTVRAHLPVPIGSSGPPRKGRGPQPAGGTLTSRVIEV
jgi:hypothetical protein